MTRRAVRLIRSPAGRRLSGGDPNVRVVVMRGVDDGWFCNRAIGANRSHGVDTNVRIDITNETGKDRKGFWSERITRRRPRESTRDFRPSALIPGE